MTLNVLLIKNGNVVGMINLNSHRNRAFSPDDITLIYTAASIRFKLLRQGAVSLTSRVLDLRDTENKPIVCTFNKGVVATATGTPERFALLAELS